MYIWSFILSHWNLIIINFYNKNWMSTYRLSAVVCNGNQSPHWAIKTFRLNPLLTKGDISLVWYAIFILLWPAGRVLLYHAWIAHRVQKRSHLGYFLHIWMPLIAIWVCFGAVWLFFIFGWKWVYKPFLIGVHIIIWARSLGPKFNPDLGNLMDQDSDP